MAKESGYAGKVKNTGSQSVKAPSPCGNGKKRTGTVRRGQDLRTGGRSGK